MKDKVSFSSQGAKGRSRVVHHPAVSWRPVATVVGAIPKQFPSKDFPGRNFTALAVDFTKSGPQ